MKSILHKSASRGFADHGWLKSRHTFSFADYHNAERMNFGALRVLNDDYVEGGMGFGTHPHNNMEIISIPLEGDLEHRDSMGTHSVITHGEVQVMSAGTGIRHSEFNHNPGDPVKFLQIWVIPDKRNVQPRYGQVKLNPADRHNTLQLIVSPVSDSRFQISDSKSPDSKFQISNSKSQINEDSKFQISDSKSQINEDSESQISNLKSQIIEDSESQISNLKSQIIEDSKSQISNLKSQINEDSKSQISPLWIHQDAWFSLGTFDQGHETTYSVRRPGNGVYFFVIKGSFSVDGTTLEERDGYGVWDTPSVPVKAVTPGAEILVMDVPMI